MLWLSRARASALGSPSLWGTPHTGRWSAASRPLPTRCQRDDQECPQVLPSVPGETADGPAGRTPLTRPSLGRPRLTGAQAPTGPPRRGSSPAMCHVRPVQPGAGPCRLDPGLPHAVTEQTHRCPSQPRRETCPYRMGTGAIPPVCEDESHLAGLAGVPHGFPVAPDRHWPTSHVQCLPLRRSRCAACTQTSARREQGRAAGNGPAGAAGGAGPQASVPSQLCLLAP